MARQSPLKLLGVLPQVRRLTDDGVSRTPVDASHALEQLAAAIAVSIEAGRTGKIMLRIGAAR